MTILATIVVLGVLIFVHELGHFVAAKAVGIDVQRFSIGLGPRVLGAEYGGTEYVLSAIPLGGYVKMAGMADEAVTGRIEGGVEAETHEPGPGDFDSKPIWARTIVISAGVVMNMAFAFAVLAFNAAYWGRNVVDTTRVGVIEARYLPDGAEGLTELPLGSHIVRVGGEEVEHWGDVTRLLAEASPGPLTIEHTEPAGSVEVRVPVLEEDRRRLAGSMFYWVDPRVDWVEPGSPAAKAGLEPGDRVLTVDGLPVRTWWDFVDEIEERPEVVTELQVSRGDETVFLTVTPARNETVDPVTGEDVVQGRVGVQRPLEELVHIEVTLAQAVVIGWRETVNITAIIVGFLRDLFTGDISPRSVGSIFTIGEASGQAAAMGLETFLRFMALFSVNLAVLNLLPIPVLDGGHLLFLAIEKVRGKALSIEQRLKWSNVGFLIVMGLMVWALSNDVLRLLGL